MPLFKKGGANFSDSRKGDGDKKLSNNRSSGVVASNNQLKSTAPQSTVQVPPPQQQQASNSNASRTSNPPQPELRQQPVEPPPPPPKFVFYCQLAHGSATGKVEGFTNVKELYQKIAEVFKLHANEVSVNNLCKLKLNCSWIFSLGSEGIATGIHAQTICFS